MSALKLRDAVIAEHIATAMRHTRLSYEAFAQTVLDQYHARTPDTLRNVRFHAVPHADPYATMRANAQIVRRLVEGTVRMPVEIEEALVLALPEPFRAACVRDLAQRYGLLAAAAPADDGAGQTVQMGDLLRSAGDSIAALAPMFDDGEITPCDAPHAPAALIELERLQGYATTMIAMIRAHAVPPANITRLRRAS